MMICSKQLNKNMIDQCAQFTPNYCLQNRKIILVCDMDQTLLTETCVSNQIIMRPRIKSMLKKLIKLYDLCLVTYSTRDRTYEILANYLDPKSKLFQNRILCREDIWPHFSNKLEAFLAHLPKTNSNVIVKTTKHNFFQFLDQNKFQLNYRKRPSVWTYVVALDDTPSVWASLKACIPIKPFFFNQDRTMELAYVHSLGTFLQKLHKMVFQMHDHNGIKTIQTAHSVMTRLRFKHFSSYRFQSICFMNPASLIKLNHENEDENDYNLFKRPNDFYKNNNAYLKKKLYLIL